MIEKGSMFKAWEATTEQQKKAHESKPSTRPRKSAGQQSRSHEPVHKEKDPRTQRGESRSRPVRGTGRMGKP